MIAVDFEPTAVDNVGKCGRCNQQLAFVRLNELAVDVYAILLGPKAGK